MTIVGIRGAIDVAENSERAIEAATQRLLRTITATNDIQPERIVSVFLTATVDLNASYPAAAARRMGWTDVPLLGAQEIEVPGAMPRVIRVLVHVNTDRSRDGIRHVYLGRAARLRPDLAQDQQKS